MLKACSLHPTKKNGSCLPLRVEPDWRLGLVSCAKDESDNEFMLWGLLLLLNG